ncbi:MAG TPA: RcnB family protein [Steroidobacteraceae bacterium]|nr:RcnB family protein [Steroidobacteraceae bacterium]
MKAPLVTSILLGLAVAAANTQAFADEHDQGHDHDSPHYVHHDEWRKGSKMRDEDWKRGAHVDYREHHLRAPPRGYEWREVDGNYVMVAVASGVIASVVAAEIAAH